MHNYRIRRPAPALLYAYDEEFETERTSHVQDQLWNTHLSQFA